ncbi:MAG: hypothetical protein HKN34_11370, partial [Gammaproteobacteria bacterium]|nr:hypothetical protein [Gammaproteobacteria bacterium]
MIMCAFSKNTLCLGGNNKISFNFDIAKAVSYDELAVVMLKIPSGVKFNENVFGVDTDGRIKWQVEKIFPESDDSPYVDILKFSDGLYAINWSGVRTKINLDTGKVIH